VTASHSPPPATAHALTPPDHSKPNLAPILDRLPELGGARFEVADLPGGLTNRNYKLTSPAGRHLVARVSSRQSELLAINREFEYRNAVAASTTGVGPAVVGYLSGEGVMVVDWIEARTFVESDLDDSANLARVAETCCRLHAGPRFVNDFDMFEVQRGYLAIVNERGFRLPPRYVDFMPQVQQIQQAMTVLDEGTVPCHNDLLAANIMASGSRMWFIDYEYAGNNDPCFELGNIWSEADLDLARLEELVFTYYGYASRAKVARARLMGLMSKYGWMLWASIQHAISDVDFDFWSWGMEKYERAIAEFDGPEFAELITDVQQAR
jgi:thiamine kinase-like enzyme